MLERVDKNRIECIKEVNLGLLEVRLEECFCKTLPIISTDPEAVAIKKIISKKNN